MLVYSDWYLYISCDLTVSIDKLAKQIIIFLINSNIIKEYLLHETILASYSPYFLPLPVLDT